jgi:hypothetical protein
MNITTEESTALTADSHPLAAEVTITLDQIRALQVTDAQSYGLVAGHLKALKDLDGRVDALFRPHIKRAFDTHRGLTGDCARARKPIQDVITEKSRECMRWKQEDDRWRRDEEERLAQEEQQRQEALALEQAATLERQGQHDLAAAVVQQATEMPAPVVVLSPPPKVQGVATVERYDFEVTDPSAVPREFCSPDPRLIRLRVQALKSRTQIPGVRVFRADSMRVSR